MIIEKCNKVKTLPRCHLVNLGFRAMVKMTKLIKKKLIFLNVVFKTPVAIFKNASYIAHAHSEISKNVKIIKKCVFGHSLFPPKNRISIRCHLTE